MMLVKTTLKESDVHGIGVYADQFIPKGTEVWRFTPGFDVKFTREQILNFPPLLQQYLYKYTWRSRKSFLYIFSADNGKQFNQITPLDQIIAPIPIVLYYYMDVRTKEPVSTSIDIEFAPIVDEIHQCIVFEDIFMNQIDFYHILN